MLRSSSDPYRDPSLEQRFAPAVWKRGGKYFFSRKVTRLRFDDDAQGWRAEVVGTADEPYAVWLSVSRYEGRPAMSSACDCPADDPCKHVAALLHAVAMRDSRFAKDVGPASLLEDEPSTDEQANAQAHALQAMTRWVDAVRREHTEDRSKPRTAATPEVAYQVQVERGAHQSRSNVVIEAYSARRRKDGTLGKPRLLDLDSAIFGRSAPACMTPKDDALWTRLTRLRHTVWGWNSAKAITRNEVGRAVFEDFIRTGRCFHGSVDREPLTLGPTRQGELRWKILEDGRQRLQTLLLESIDDSGETPEPLPAADCVVLPLSPPHYLDPLACVVGPLELGVAAQVAAMLADAPVLEPEVAAALSQSLRESLHSSGLPLPAKQKHVVVSEREPRPRICVTALDPDAPALGTLQAAVHFDYGPARTPAAAGPGPLPQRLVDAGVVYQLRRDPQAEATALESLSLLADCITHRSRRGALTLVLDALRPDVDLVGTLLPQLAATGWTIDLQPVIANMFVTGERWFIETTPEGGAWFALELGIEIDGVRVNLLPAVVRAIGTGRLDGERLEAQPLRVRLDDGRWVNVPPARLRRVLDVLVELHALKNPLTEGRLRLPASEAGRMLDLDNFEWLGDGKLRPLAEQLRGAKPLPTIRTPSTLRAELREYQSEGLNWLGFLRKQGFGGILADDMGLGKTIQTLAHLLAEKRARRLDRPALVVAPRSALKNWSRECERFAPSLRHAIFHGPARGSVLEDPPDLVITTFALLQRDASLQAMPWHFVALDEAQAIKNPRTAVATAARALDARQRVCLTGTPMENSLSDLWSLFAFAAPGLLGGKQMFDRVYRKPIERGDTDRLNALSARIAPFMLRRTKAAVLQELPPKTEVLVSVPLEAKQRDLYESVRLTMETKVRKALQERGLARSKIVVLDALLKLRQVCCHPKLVKVPATRKEQAKSAKTERLLELVDELVAQDRRAIIFSQFTSMLALIEPELDARGVSHQSITGKTRKRQQVVDAFQAGDCSVLLISLKAGGTALNLTAADTVIHYDPWWNPAVEAQATDRAHRIGQTQPVTVIRLVCEGSVEERVLALQARKAALTGALQRGAESRSEHGLQLVDDDVSMMLAPLA